MSYDVLEGDTVYVTELHASDFVKKDFVIKRGVICAGPGTDTTSLRLMKWVTVPHLWQRGARWMHMILLSSPDWIIFKITSGQFKTSLSSLLTWLPCTVLVWLNGVLHSVPSDWRGSFISIDGELHQREKYAGRVLTHLPAHKFDSHEHFLLLQPHQGQLFWKFTLALGTRKGQCLASF